MDQKELTSLLQKASEAYYNTGVAIMSDLEFDQKLEELKAMEAESGIVFPGSPTTNVGAVVEGVTLEEVTHEQPALSLDKVKYKDVQDLKKWLGDRQGIVSWKMDGMTLVLTFDDGKLTSAVTRGDGYVGEDVTANAKYIDGIPQQISYTDHLVVRGEAVMTYEEFERVNAEAGGIYQNPRNLVPGTLRSGEAANRKITFYAFELVTPEPQAMFVEDNSFNLVFQGDRLNWLETLGFNIVDKEYVTSGDILEKVEEWKEDVEQGYLKFPTDGLVISYNDMMYGMTLGNNGHHFRHSVALKWTDETEVTTIRDVEWSVGKTGLITPVAIFDPVRLGAGSTVTRASLHNLSIMNNRPWFNMEDNYDIKGRVMIGSKAKVYLANLIIPQIYSVENVEGDMEVKIPETCPCCGGPTVIKENNGVKTLFCENPNCSAKQAALLMNTFGKDGLFIKGLGESQIEDLMAAGLVTDALSFYQLAENVDKDTNCGIAYLRLLDKDGWGDKRWNNLMSAIEASRKTTLQKFLYSLNIPLCGNDLSKKLAKHWNNDAKEILRLTALSPAGYDNLYEELTAIDGIGKEKAQYFVDYFRNINANQDAYANFVQLMGELDFPEATLTPTDSSLAGLTFVITGAVNQYKNRDEFKASVEARGGKVAGSVSAKTSFLVNNDVASTSGKNQKAKELGIPIISEDEFISRFGK